MPKNRFEEPCYCGSEKPYNICCMGIGRFKLPGTEAVPETRVIGALLETSPQLRALFQTEVPSLGRRLIWLRDPNLPVGIDARATTKADVALIRLRTTPATDATLVAHEIAHIVINESGFPLTGGATKGDRDYETVSAALNNMLHHPKVHRLLLSWGFDLLGMWKREEAESVRQLSKYTQAPADAFVRAQWSFNHVTTVMNWTFMMVKDLVASDDRPYQDLVEERFPKVAVVGEEIMALMNRMGFETPDQHFAIYEEMIHRFKLAPYVKAFRSIDDE